MLYIQEKNFIRQLKFLRFLVADMTCDIVFWAFPESALTNLDGIPLTEDNSEGLEQVTTYSDGHIPRRSHRLRCSASFFQYIFDNEKLVAKNIDSLCIYKVLSREWLACTVGHEGMGLVRDDALYSQLKAAGFPVSRTPPDWW